MPSIKPGYFKSIRSQYDNLEQQYQNIVRIYNEYQFDGYEILMDLGEFYDNIYNDVVIKIRELIKSQKLVMKEKEEEYDEMLASGEEMISRIINIYREVLQLGPYSEIDIRTLMEYEIYRLATMR